MKSFFYSSLHNPLKLRAKIQKSTIIYENYNNFFTNLCCSGSFDVVSRNYQSTRRFALWCWSSPSCTSPQHRRALGHWATWYCFTKLLGDAPTAPFFRRLDPFLQLLLLLFARSSPFFPSNFKYLKLQDSSLAIQKRCLEQFYTRHNHECTQQDSIYLCKDQMCTQRFKFSTIVFKCPHTKDDSIFTPWFHSLKLWNQMQCSLSQRRT
ncbi:hypothetical protein H5410_040801 [Solanum commersonii]|uniref:Uncharacterized protein n=1 Tax=Solanum commersonii TaxID=4109 RepID=A0A9J5XRW4_SOLCO|nr:hypothetical protein H5410_040801 [Solanum commersonii]